jgi:DNA-binding MarR family transcriptional regulator
VSEGELLVAGDMRKGVTVSDDLDRNFTKFMSITNALFQFRKLDANFPLAGMLALLHTGLTEADPTNSPALSITDLAGRADVDRQTMARIIRFLGDGDDRIGGKLRIDREGGLGLVETFSDLEDKRIKRVRLTQPGRDFVSSVLAVPLINPHANRLSLTIKRKN